MSEYEFMSISEPLDVGTRIHYDESTNSAYFVDVPNCNVYRYDLNSGTTTKAKIGDEPLAFLFPVAGSNSKFVAGLGRKFVFIEWDGYSPKVSNIETIAEIETDDKVKDNRLNGAKVDPWGRLWAGTMGPSDANGDTIPHKGALYSLEQGKVKQHICSIGISNGLAWNTDTMKMYYIDTLEPRVFQFDFSEDGTLSNKKVVFEFGPNNIEGKPDGLTIDAEGNLWFTAIFGSTLVKFSPNTGEVKDKIVLPTPQPTSISFGGENLDKMFVATARIPVNGEVPPSPAGSTYIIKNTGVTGFKGDRYIS